MLPAMAAGKRPDDILGADFVTRMNVLAEQAEEGDYYGQTVNVAARIADYARPGEVLVSQEVVDASGGAELAFREIGPVELKGVSGAIRLHAASRPG